MNDKDKKIVIIGAGTAGIMLANKLAKQKYKNITVIDPSLEHYYQPGFLFMPFGRYKLNQLKKPLSKLINKRVNHLKNSVSSHQPDQNIIVLDNGDTLQYDVLVIATGTRVDPNMTEGLAGTGWYRDIFDFYTPEGATKLHDALSNIKTGRIVVQIMDMPIKCPVAPLEFAFLTDNYLKKKGLRNSVSLHYVTPLSGAFTKPVASAKFGNMLSDRNIELIADFYTEKVVPEERKVVCYDGREVKYDLLVVVPVNTGVPLFKGSAIANELGFISVNHGSLQSTKYPNIFAIGDAADLPTSKAGSVAHFEVETLVENVPNFLKGEPLEESFDGHSNCFVEMGSGKALLLDFNYETQPYEGTFPLPGIGPMKLLKPSRINHLGKIAFRYIYWLMLLPGRKIPFIPARMNTKGKKIIKE